jgi:hypothetical protein
VQAFGRSEKRKKRSLKKQQRILFFYFVVFIHISFLPNLHQRRGLRSSKPGLSKKNPRGARASPAYPKGAGR